MQNYYASFSFAWSLAVCRYLFFYRQRCILRLRNAAHETLNVVLMENKLTDGLCAWERKSARYSSAYKHSFSFMCARALTRPKFSLRCTSCWMTTKRIIEKCKCSLVLWNRFTFECEVLKKKSCFTIDKKQLFPLYLFQVIEFHVMYAWLFSSSAHFVSRKFYSFT